ncbi:MAG TPA: YlzJ-like family protein [Mobilitalea sp.]|nr:YlzJ-like family protein [Mobilitalea sp.]
MLYTVMPLERIYTDFSERNKATMKAENTETQEYKEVMLDHGRVVTRREGDNYIVERINSTNMGDYLNADYAPGKTVDSNKK